ncbi:hypothetical protein [Vagococcus sp. WN89Y]|uniref:hypothetical protein n=1 Tax=Vagococcus sp. WN89Y TaxID=3457258 RepID=UPI003FCC3F9A
MVNNFKSLLLALESIVSELKRSGNNESASFFLLRYDELKRHSDKIPQKIIEELTTCRAMSQYANFTLKEEELLDIVVDNAIAIKNTIP